MGNTAMNSAAYQGYYNMLGANALANTANQFGNMGMAGIKNYQLWQDYVNGQNVFNQTGLDTQSQSLI
jgi:hypothetical protein